LIISLRISDHLSRLLISDHQGTKNGRNYLPLILGDPNILDELRGTRTAGGQAVVPVSPEMEKDVAMRQIKNYGSLKIKCFYVEKDVAMRQIKNYGSLNCVKMLLCVRSRIMLL
jgi:hypothetical protein